MGNDYERLPERSEAFIYMPMARLIHCEVVGLCVVGSMQAR
jgi:hypothetical protein